MQRIRLSAARGGDQIWQSDVSLKSVSDGTERERRILQGGGRVKRERCWVNWRSWKEEGMRRNEGRDRWNTGKTFPKMVRAPVRASLSKYERRERRKKKEALGAEAPPYFPLSPRSCWTNTHLFLLIGAGLAETTGTYWLLLTFQNTVSAASGSAAAAAAACAHTLFLHVKKKTTVAFFQINIFWKHFKNVAGAIQQFSQEGWCSGRKKQKGNSTGKSHNELRFNYASMGYIKQD